MSPEGETIRTFVGNFLKEKLDNFLHKHPENGRLAGKNSAQ